jgi:hypothetical protein
VNRAERRKKERQYKKEYSKAEKKKETLYKWIDTLSKDKYELIIGEIKRQSVNHGNSVMESVDRCLTALMIEEYDMELEEVQVFMTKLINNMGEDTEKINKLKNMLGGRYMKTLEDIKNKMIKEAREMMEGGMKDKDIKQKLNMEYPQLSKSMVTNAVKRIRTEYNKEVAADVTKLAAAMGVGEVTKEDLEKANIIESDTEPSEEESTPSEEFIEEDAKTSENVQNKARNGIEIKSRKKSETLEVQGSNYNYTVIKTQDNLNSLVEVIREDGVRYTSLEELENIRQKAIDVINQEFEEGKAVFNV